MVRGKMTAEGEDESEVEWWIGGCYAFRKPGMHGPFESRSECLMFVVCTPAGEWVERWRWEIRLMLQLRKFRRGDISIAVQ